MRYLCGLDLGQANDWSALVVVEQSAIEGAPTTARWLYNVRHVDRVRRVKYDKVAERARDLVERLGAAVLVVDKTGVGAPIVDLLSRFGIRSEVVPVTITGGDSPVKHGGEWSVPKRDLASTVAVCLQTDRLRIGPEVPHAETLVREMQNFRVKVSLSGADTYEAWRSADKDDLVLAVALAVWYGEKALSFTLDDVGGGGVRDAFGGSVEAMETLAKWGAPPSKSSWEDW